MKKLMMLVAGVACTFCVSAAAIDWQFTEAIRTDKGTANDLTGYSAYFFTAAAWDTVTAAVSGGSLSDTSKFTGYLGSAAIGVTTAATAKTYATGVQKVNGSLTEGTYYIVLADLTNGGDVWSKSITTTAAVYDDTADPVPSHVTAAWSLSKTATGSYLNDSNASFTASVPEPTSGLMLLLGIAGLALKRKRA